jgi:endonuclease/exonuclease/phosphatase family metal-dependent hydrolase
MMASPEAGNERVPASASAPAPIADVWRFNIVCWNVFLRSRRLFQDGQQLRANHIARLFCEQAEFASADMVVLCEVFDQECAVLLGRAMTEAGYTHQTRVLGQEEHQSHHILQTVVLQQRLLVMNGGVVIYSRHPILAQHYAFFQGNDIDALDACSMKGFVYVRVRIPASADGHVPSRIVNVIGTHLQATRSSEGDRMRLKQMYRIYKFVREQFIPCNEPVIVAGDLNQDSDATTHEGRVAFDTLLTTAQLMPLPHQTPHPHGRTATVNPDENNLVGRDTDVSIPASCLDHCAFATTHLRPLLISDTFTEQDTRAADVIRAISSSCVTLKPVTREAMTFGLPGVFYRRDMVGITTHHLSDHFALLARMVFPVHTHDCTTTLPSDSFFSMSNGSRLVHVASPPPPPPPPIPQ